MSSAPLAQSHPPSSQDFFAQIQTDTRSDNPGVSTVVVVGGRRFIFDCGLPGIGSLADVGSSVSPVSAVFLTRVDEMTTSGIERLLTAEGVNSASEPPVRIWGPRGTRDWMLASLGDSAARESPRRPFTVVDVDEGSIFEAGGLLVLALTVSDGTFAYRIAYDGRSMLIATDVTVSEHLIAATRAVDVAIIRHTDGAVAARLLERIRPRLAVLAQDGIPASVTQIREDYRGALHIAEAGSERVDVPARAALAEGGMGRRP
jgi:hypothetical protein